MLKNGPCKGLLQSGKIKTWVFDGLLQKISVKTRKQRVGGRWVRRGRAKQPASCT